MDKTRLLEQIAASRNALQADCKNLRDEWNFSQKAAQAVRSKPVKWMGGALLSGYLLAKLRGRPKPAKRGKSGAVNAAKAARVKKFGFWAALVALVRFLAPLLRPA
ncbi:MAG TPA: hypothetical protein VIS74_05475, partial [Chthoniobacterales bacterium]